MKSRDRLLRRTLKVGVNDMPQDGAPCQMSRHRGCVLMRPPRSSSLDMALPDEHAQLGADSRVTRSTRHFSPHLLGRGAPISVQQVHDLTLATTEIQRESMHGPGYSQRSATRGSTFVARRAGKEEGAGATTANKPTTNRKVGASKPINPNSHP